MTIWLLALVLLASCAGLGYRQGAIRVGFSFFGIVLGALLAGPLSKLVKPALMAVGIKSPILLWALGPLIIFVIISALFKIAGYAVHQKVDVYYKYKVGELRLALWERLHHRLGLCLGLLNGTAYLVLIALGIYAFSYWTVQMANAETDPKTLKIVNRLGRDLQSTGFIKVAQALAPMPATFYDAADVVGVVYNNPLSEARLSRYPAFLGLSERQELQQLGSDQGFADLRARQEPIKKVLENPQVRAILDNRELLQAIWDTVIPDTKDLEIFLRTGKSPKYDSEAILGRWHFDLNLTVGAMRRAKPNTTSSEMQKMKKWMVGAFQNTQLLAMTDHHAILKNLPPLKAPAAGAPQTGGLQTLQGQWKSLDGGKYLLSLGSEELPAMVEGDRVTVTAGTFEVALSRQD